MGRRLCIVCALGVVCVFPGAAQAAVADYLGKPVAAVRLTIEERETTDPALTQIVATEIGRPLSMAQVRESLTHLYSLGRFEGVSVDATLENGRVLLHYELSPIHSVTSIRFEGPSAAGVQRSALRRAITDRYGVTPQLTRTADMARTVEGVLADLGYLHPVVTSRAEISHDPDQAALVFAVDPKARTTIGTVDIVGTPSVPPAELRKKLRLATGTPYAREPLNARIEKYLTDRRKHGYYEARIVPAVAFADDDRVANVTLTVDPGPLVRVVFAGDPLGKDLQQAFVPIEREGSADEDLLEDASHRIEEHFRAQGYRDAAAPHTRQTSDNELLITFTIVKGPLYRVTEYEISGNSSVSLDEIVKQVRVDQPFVDARLDADITAIETAYRRAGYARVRAQPTTRFAASPQAPAIVPVSIALVVLEGPRTAINRIAIAGNASMDDATLRSEVRLEPGGPYVPSTALADRDRIQLKYQNAGYQNAAVEVMAEASADGTAADVTFRVNEGPRIFIDHVLIVGNVRTKTETIERELQIKPNEPFSLDKINESQRRLTALGLFRRARITEVGHGSETTRDLLVSIEEAPPTTIGYGAGVEARRAVLGADENGQARERYDVAPRALFEISRRNLFGRNRSASLFTSVSRSVRYSLTEYRAVATFREPRLFDTPADAFVNATLEQQHRSSFDFARRSLSANLQRRFDNPYSVIASYQLQRTRVFNLQPSEGDPNLIERAFPKYLLSSFSGTIIRDTRDDPVDAKSGNYFSGTGQLASEAIGSEFAFVKATLNGQMFRRVPHTNQVVFAGNARLGLARGYTSVVDPLGIEQKGPLPPSERFFAGGDTTQRAYALDQLGVRHTPPQEGDTINADGFAIGGNAILLFNGELRVPVTSSLGVVGFLDTGNVFANASDIAAKEFRTAIGSGVRYKSPVGPLRFDFGFNISPRPGEKRTAWFVNFGQAF